MYAASLKKSKNYKAQPYQYASPFKQILKAKAKPFPPCTHCGFNDHILDDYRNYPKCGIYKSYDHFTLRHNRVIHIQGGVFNTRRHQVEETYHVTFDESMEAIRLDSDVSYYVIPLGRSLTELTQENLVPEVIALNEPDIPLTKDNEGPPDLINTKGTYEQNVQNEQITTQPIEGPSENNTKISVSINESSFPDGPQSHISNQASTSSHPAPQDRWSKDQHIELVNIIGDPGEGMLTRSMDAKLTDASAIECLFADFLSEIKPKSSSVKTPMVPPNNLGPDLAGKPVNETSYREMIGSLVKITLGACQILGGKLVCWSAKKQRSVAMSLVEAEYVDVVGCCLSTNCPCLQANLQVLDELPTKNDLYKISPNPLPKLPRGVWCMAIAYDPNPSTNENKPRPLKEFLIKFTVMNGKKPLTLNFNTFTVSTGLDYNNGAYVAHASPRVVKAELAKIVMNLSYLDKTSVLKNSFLVAWRIMLPFVIQVLSRNYSSTEHVNSIQQLITYSLITGIKVDIGEIIYSDLVTKLLNKSRLRYVSYGHEASKALSKKRKQPKLKKTPSETKRNIQLASMGLPSTLDERTRKSQPFPKGTTTDPKDSFGNDQPANKRLPSTTSNKGMAKTTSRSKGPLRDKDSGGNKQPTDMEPINPTVADPLGTESDEEEVFEAGEYIDEDTQVDTEVHPDLKKFNNILPLIERQLVKYLMKVSSVLFNRLTEAHIARGDLLNALNEVTDVGNKMHKAFPLPGESSHWQYKFPLPVG
nr:hypothetical protein [Tanacetum cinerariifolium]